MKHSETPGDDVAITIIIVLGIVITVCFLVPYWESIS